MSNDVKSRGGWDLLLLSGEHTSLNGANNRSAFVQLPPIRAPAHQNMFGVATPGQKGWQGGKVLQRGGNWLHRGGKEVAIGVAKADSTGYGGRVAVRPWVAP